MRGFSLIETMFVVVILAIFAALTVPSLFPRIHIAQMDGAAEGAANLFARARSEAMVSKRCVRVKIVAGDLIVERLNSFDCEYAAAAGPAAPFNDPSGAAFTKVDSLKPENPNVRFSFAAADGGVLPAGVGLAGASLNTMQEVRFRPNGRVWSDDVTAGTASPILTNDDAILTVRHTRLTATVGAPRDRRRILIDGNGLVCAFPRGVVPVGPNFNCP